MKEIEIKGDTPEKKFAHLEIILRRMFRRLHRTVIGLIPASPIFGYCMDPNEDPHVLRVIFPADGIITKAAFRAEKCGKETRIMVGVTSGETEFTQAFNVRSKATVEEIDFHVEAGDSLEVWISSPREEDRGFWVGFLYQVGMKDLTSVELLVDQFEALIEGGGDDNSQV